MMSGSGRIAALVGSLLLLIMVMRATPLHADSPFAMPGTTSAPMAAPASSGTTGAENPHASFTGWAMAKQQGYYRAMAKALRALSLDQSLAAAWALLSISFFYGVFHAVGPGHGKIVVSSYLLANEKELTRGIFIAFLSSFMQALTAIIMVGVLALLLGLAHRTTLDAVPLVERISYTLLALMGGWLVWRALQGRLAANTHAHAGHEPQHGHSHDHDHDHQGHAHAHMPTPQELSGAQSGRDLLAMVMAVGLRPCSGAILVLLFALAQGSFLIGTISTFAMSIGTALTVSSLALMTVFSKNMALRLAGLSDDIWARRLEFALRLGGGLLICLMGLVLLVASFDAPPQPFP